MILFEEEKSKLLLAGMPYLRPLYIKGILSMYEILSISWNESLIDLKTKFEKLNSTKEKLDKPNNKDNEIKELNNKMFLIFSFMNHFYQMINKGKLKKYEGLDYIYSKLNSFFTLCRKIISYKILDIDLEEFNQTKIILKLITHVKLFLIFCEYDTYGTKEEFIEDILLTFNPKENHYKENIEENNNDNKKEKKENENEKEGIKVDYTNKEKEEKVIKDLIKEIKNQNINLENIYLYTNKIYISQIDKFKNFINDDKITFVTILYEKYFDINSNVTDDKENSDEDENNNKNNNNTQQVNKKKRKKKKNKKKKNQEKNENNNIILNINNYNINEIKQESKEKNEINIDNKEIKEEKKDTEENKNNKLARINEKITIIKTIQSIAKMANKLVNNISFTENNSAQKDTTKEKNKISLPQSKSDFDEIKKRFLEPLIPYIKQYQKVYGNKKMSILSLMQCAFIVYEEKYRKEKEKLLNEINNLKKAMNHMFIQIQLMGGGRDIFRSTLYYLILIFIPEEQNEPSFFTRVQKLINFFENKVNSDLNLIKNLSSGNMNVIINRLHQNSQYVLFVKSLFFMYKFFNFIVHLNKNEKLQKNNEQNKIENENQIRENSLISKMNSKNIKYNLPLIKEYFSEEENSITEINSKKNLIYPTFNFSDCFSSYSNFLDEIVTNEKTQIILEQVINKIETENKIIDGPKFEIKDLFVEKNGKKVFNLTGFDVQVIIHDIKKMKYKEETLENLVNSKTWEKSQQEP